MLCLAVFVVLWAGVCDLLCVYCWCAGLCVLHVWFVVHACDMCGMDVVLCCCMC